MDVNLKRLWAKTKSDEEHTWHPLLLHMIDVGLCAENLLEREPESTRRKMAQILGMEWEKAKPWLQILIACHDLGKASAGFQCKWKNMTSLESGKMPDTDVNHAFVSQIALASILVQKGFDQQLTVLLADAIGCHHGVRANPTQLEYLEGNFRALGNDGWKKAREALFEELLTFFKPSEIPPKDSLTGPDFMLLSGLTSFSDWIGSNERWFPFGADEDCDDLEHWGQERRHCAKRALDEIGWEERHPLSLESKSFGEAFGFAPRPLQIAVAQAIKAINAPSILLVEAPMGEGKTEAAFYAYLELQRNLDHRGMYLALPTKATGNAMFERTLAFLQSNSKDRRLDLQLVHGAKFLNDTFQNIVLSGVYDPSGEGDVRAGEWFTNKKRALLSEYGVGTADQAIVPILPVRHNFVRLWGLANRVVVFDEIHAYDAYTGTLLFYLIRWLLALGSTVILLSATIPRTTRKKISELVEKEMPEEKQYPRLTIYNPNESVTQMHFAADQSRRLEIRLQGISPDINKMKSAIEDGLKNDGMGIIVVNTVQRAQELFCSFPEGNTLKYKEQQVGKQLEDGTEVFLFHARYPADLRQIREDRILEIFGKNGKRDGRKILIATQVAEQSLDLDFDVMATDLAPIDLILQRAGRLWRHSRPSRPVSEPTLLIAGLNGQEPPSFGDPLWWCKVYNEYILLTSWILLKGLEKITMPDDIDRLVQIVYEKQMKIPDEFQENIERLEADYEGEISAHRSLAAQSIIGFPEDASWNDPARFIYYDEDEGGVHRTLIAKTRLGEDSVNVVPIFSSHDFSSEATPEFYKARELFIRSISLSRKGVVNKLKSQGVPNGWKKSSLLRNCYPLILNEDGLWKEDDNVKLDDQLGIVYKKKEKA